MVYPENPIYASSKRMYEEIRLLRKQNLAVDILFFVGLNGNLVIFLISLIIFLSKFFLLLIPVPTAVPP